MRKADWIGVSWAVAWMVSLPLSSHIGSPWPAIVVTAALFPLASLMDVIDNPGDEPGANYIVGMLSEFEVAGNGHTIERLGGRWQRCTRCHGNLYGPCGQRGL